MEIIWNCRSSSGSSEIRCQAEKMTESKGGIPKAPVCDLRTLMIPNGYAPPLEIDISLSSDCVV
jgi:hypothetical protein